MASRMARRQEVQGYMSGSGWKVPRRDSAMLGDGNYSQLRITWSSTALSFRAAAGMSGSGAPLSFTTAEAENFEATWIPMTPTAKSLQQAESYLRGIENVKAGPLVCTDLSAVLASHTLNALGR